MSVKTRLSDLAYAGGWSAVRRMPEPAARSLFGSIADLAVRRDGTSVRQLRRNLARVRPDLSPHDLDDLVHDGMRRYLRYWREAFRLPGLSPEEIVATLRPSGLEHFDGALATGRGAVAALPHMGNWDHAGAWFAVTRGQLTTVAERLKPESLYERFLAYREQLGMEVLPLTGGPRVLPILSRRLREGKLVALLADRDLTRHGLTVDFFGSPATMPAGPAALAVQTGAALIPTTLWYEGERTRCAFHPPVAIATEGSRGERIQGAVQALADVFAAGIAEHPADWHMLQPLWTADLDPARRGTRSDSSEVDEVPGLEDLS